MHLHAVTSIERLVSPGPWNLRQFRDSLKDHNGNVLLVGEYVRGFAIYTVGIEHADLLNIGLEPSFQGQGFGRLLLKSMIWQMKPLLCKTGRHNCSYLTLCAAARRR